MFGLAFLGVSFLAISSYTSLSINSDDFMNDNEIKFVKRLDELNGHTVRSVASIKPMHFEFGSNSPAPKPALAKVQKFEKKGFLSGVKNFFQKENDAPKVKAAIMQELDLTLTEVYSPKKYNIPLTKEQFEGSLRANNGIIESMEVRLPNDEGMSISNIEMNGNIFTCKIGDESYSGMIFTTDNKSFMVSFTEGNMEGTRFKFDALTAVADDNQQEVAVDQNGQQPQAQPEQGGFEQAQAPAQQPQEQQDYAQQEPVRVDINPQDPSYAQQQTQQGMGLPPVNGQESAQYSPEQVEENTQTQGFNFSAGPQANQSVDQSQAM